MNVEVNQVSSLYFAYWEAWMTFRLPFRVSWHIFLPVNLTSGTSGSNTFFPLFKNFFDSPSLKLIPLVTLTFYIYVFLYYFRSTVEWHGVFNTWLLNYIFLSKIFIKVFLHRSYSVWISERWWLVKDVDLWKLKKNLHYTYESSFPHNCPLLLEWPREQGGKWGYCWLYIPLPSVQNEEVWL